MLSEKVHPALWSKIGLHEPGVLALLAGMVLQLLLHLLLEMLVLQMGGLLG